MDSASLAETLSQVGGFAGIALVVYWRLSEMSKAITQIAESNKVLVALMTRMDDRGYRIQRPTPRPQTEPGLPE